MAAGPTEGKTTNLAAGGNLILLVVRCLFLFILGGTAAKLAIEISPQFGDESWLVGITFCAIMLVGIAALVLDVLYPKKRISSISAVFFGLIVGSILGYFLKIAFAPTLSMWFNEDVISWFSVILTTILCYICVSVLLQTKDDFRFVIPYVEFAPQLKGARPLILDSSVIIDGRIADIAESGLIDQAIVIPAFVLNEVQAIADSPDKVRRKRGLRGLEIVDRLRSAASLEVDIRDDGMEGRDRRDVATRLILMAKDLGGRVVTNDVTLAKAAKIQNVESLNLNDVSNALKPPVLWGDRISVAIVKEGEGPGQGVGYLDDGTMVVVEQGRRFIGAEVNLIVDSFLQTSAGRMVFGRIDSKNPSPAQPASADGTGGM
jgi:uncharacterized protein YacL